ncbi:MAG: carboxypeptidase-like regulatory domain-containing protein, partial [bacterium]
MFRFIMTRTVRTIAMVMVPAMCAFAQSTGRIVGRVTDAQGAGVSGAQIIVSPAGISAISAEDGRYTARSVPSGTASLRAYRFGYKPRNVEGIAVTAGQDITVNIQFEAATVQL